MNRNIKYLIYILSFVILGIVCPKGIYAEETCDGSEYQCIVCEGKIDKCDIKFVVKADGNGGVQEPVLTQKLNDGSNYASCKYTSSAVSSNFINSDKTSLSCPTIFYFTRNTSSNGRSTQYKGNVYFDKTDNKKEYTGDLKETTNNNKPFKKEGVDTSNSKSCKYKSTSGVTTVTVNVIINNGELSYELTDGWKVSETSDITADMFEGKDCSEVEIFVSCGNNRNNKYCTLSKTGNGRQSSSTGSENLNSGEISDGESSTTKKTKEILDVETGENYTCENLKNTKTYGYIKDAFFLIQIIVPIMLLIFGSLDFIKAIAAQNDDAMKKAQSTFVKRLIIAVVIVLLPPVLNLVFGFLTDAFEITTCGIGNSTEQVKNN